jgi:hypothetical protein
MKWLLPCVALALMPLASSCASTPIYGDWVIEDYCGNHWSSDTRTWRRIEAPANADAFRAVAATDASTSQATPEGAREYWFAADSGETKLCRTNLQRAAGRWHWCRPQLAIWWVFRETAGRIETLTSQEPICVT